MDTAETYMAAQLSPQPLMLNMDVQLATRKEPRSFFVERLSTVLVSLAYMCFSELDKCICLWLSTDVPTAKLGSAGFAESKALCDIC